MLTVTEMLRKKGVVDKFVEFFGDGLANLPLADRATIANMAPEYGSTCGIFPIDEETMRYLELSGRPRERIDLVDAPTPRHQGMWRNQGEQPARLHRRARARSRRPSSRASRARAARRTACRLKSAKSVYETNAKKSAEERAAKNPAAQGHAPR